MIFRVPGVKNIKNEHIFCCTDTNAHRVDEASNKLIKFAVISFKEFLFYFNYDEDKCERKLYSFSRKERSFNITPLYRKFLSLQLDVVKLLSQLFVCRMFQTEKQAAEF